MRNKKGQFIKGNIPSILAIQNSVKATKGKKRLPFSKEWRENISKANKGQKAWNKGITNIKERKCKFCSELFMPNNFKNKVKFCSKECYNNFNKGENNNFWKGGKMKEYPQLEQLRKSSEYKLWREVVFERDNWTCIWCNLRSGNGKKVILHADHIKPFALYPELRFAIDNGRTLCKDCHKKTDTYAGKLNLINKKPYG